MNKTMRLIVKAASLMAAIGLAIGCGRAESKKAAGTLNKQIEDTANEIQQAVKEHASESPASTPKKELSDPMYDISTKEEISDNAASPAGAEAQEKITQEDLERAIAALEEQLK